MRLPFPGKLNAGGIEVETTGDSEFTTFAGSLYVTKFHMALSKYLPFVRGDGSQVKIVSTR